jgi:GTP-binding protein
MKINSAKYLISSALITQCPKPDRPEYAFIGRSNVGKSSLINMVTGTEGPRQNIGHAGKNTTDQSF